MNEPNPLGRFLRARRNALDPRAVGLARARETRRVPGLRREEVAALAGVSVDYYTRIEQGRLAVSPRMLQTLGKVLRLDAAQRAYLALLARGGDDDRRCAARTVRPQVRRLLERLADTPALVLGRGFDVLAWNRMAKTLLTALAPAVIGDRNVARLLFTVPSLRTTLGDWERIASGAVAVLRMELARHPGDHHLAALVAELSRRPEFRAGWEGQAVALTTGGSATVEHPLVGTIALEWEPLSLPDDPGQQLVVVNTKAGSASERALRVLCARDERGSDHSPWPMEHSPLPGAHGR